MNIPFLSSKPTQPRKASPYDRQAVRTFYDGGLVNLVSGLGTSASKRTQGHWTYDGLWTNYREYEAAYQQSGIVRRVIDTIAEDVTREWREVKTKADTAAILAEETRTQYVATVRDALRWARLYGGAGVIMITDQPLDKPLQLERLKKGSLKNFIILDRWYFSAGGLQSFDVTSPDFMMPEYFLVAGAQSVMVHKSHVVRFSGCPLPPRLRISNFGWGDSVLRQVMQEIEDLISANGGVAEALQQFNVDIIKKEGLFTDISTDQEESIVKRFRIFNMMKSVFHTAVLDGQEDLQRKEITFAGVADMMREIMHMVCACSHIPYTRLYGSSAEGMNATGEGDADNYNDYLRTVQNADVDPQLHQMDEVLIRSALGYMPDDFSYEWKSLDTPKPLDIANANLTQANADAVYLENQIITPSQVMRKLASGEKYAFDEKRIDEIEKIEQGDDLKAIYSNEEPEEESSGEDGEGVGQKAEGRKTPSNGAA